MFRKSISLFLAILLFFGSATTGLSAISFNSIFETKASAETTEYTEGDYTYTVEYGEAKITQVDYEISGNITVPATLGGYPVTEIGNYAFGDRDKITGVTISEGIRIIGTEAFAYCYNLTEINIASSVTYLGTGAFRQCRITNVNIPANSKLKHISDSAFAWNYFTSINLPQSLEILEGAFYGCENLESITIPANVKFLGAFTYCRKLSNITFLGTINYINGQFFGFNEEDCAKIPYYSNPSNWKNGGLYIGDHLICTTQNYSGKFTVEPGTKVIAGAAFQSADITEIVLPDSLIYIGYKAFKNCEKLTEINIPANVISIGSGALYENFALTKINVDSRNAYYSSDANGVLYNKDKTLLIRYPVASSLTSYNIPNGVKVVGSYAFCYAKNLESIAFPDTLKAIDYCAFSDCSGLTQINLPEGLAVIGTAAFHSCIGLKSVIIPDSVSLIYEEAFENCQNLAEVHLPTDLNMISGYAFSYTPAVLCSDSQNSYAASFAEMTGQEFKVCNNHGRESGPSRIKTYENFKYTINNNEITILECTAAENGVIHIPSHIEGLPVTVVNTYAIRYLNSGNIKEINVPDTVVVIADHAFDSYYSVKNITVPDNVLYIGNEVIDNWNMHVTATINKSNLLALENFYYNGYTVNLVGDAPIIPENPGTPSGNNGFDIKVGGNSADDEIELGYEEFLELSVYLPPEYSAYYIVWESSDSDIIYVENGNITAVGEGTATIKVYLVDANGNRVTDENGNEISSSIKITCKLTFFQKIILFFKNLFNSLFSIFA